MRKKIQFYLFIVILFLGSLLNAKEYEILAIGTPCMDILFEVPEDFLQVVKVEKGGSAHADWETFSGILARTPTSPQYAPGGSASNTIKGLSYLGHKCAIFGKIGKDEIAGKYCENIESYGVISKLISTDTPTQQVAAFITPDHQRTFRVFPGASKDLTCEDLKSEFFKNTKLVHIEGYALHNDKLVKKSMEMAKEAGALVSFDLASFILVKEHKEQILELIEKYVDILFANKEETMALTGLEPEEGCGYLEKLCKVSIVTIGDQGCWVGSKGSVQHYPALPAQVIDTTGAGDLFACGFLHGYVEGHSLDQCARYGNLIAGKVVEVIGAEIPFDKWAQLLLQIPKKQ